MPLAHFCPEVTQNHRQHISGQPIFNYSPLMNNFAKPYVSLT